MVYKNHAYDPVVQKRQKKLRIHWGKKAKKGTRERVV
jgi:hypothetical protein